MKKIQKYISDKWHRMVIRLGLLFAKNEQERKEMWIAYALCSNEGRKKLGDAMINGARKAIVEA